MLTITPNLNFGNIFFKNKEWSHELKCATTTIKRKVAKVRAEPKTIGIADLNTSATLP